MNDKKCIVCSIKIDDDNCKKDRKICKNCYNINRKKHNNKEKKPQIDNINNKIILPEKQKHNNNIPNISTYENHRHVAIGRSNTGKTYHMLKILEKICNKIPIHMITRTPNQYPNYKTSTDIKPINKYKGSVVVFDDMLGARNSSQIDESFRRGRHENLDVYYISQSYFALPRQSTRNNSDILILFKQTLRDVQSMYYDIGAYDMKYDEFKEMCHKVWDEKLIYLCIDMVKKNGGKYRIFNERKPTYIDCILETNLFWKLMIVIHIFYKQTHSYYFKCCIQLIIEKI